MPYLTRLVSRVKSESPRPLSSMEATPELEETKANKANPLPQENHLTFLKARTQCWPGQPESLVHHCIPRSSQVAELECWATELSGLPFGTKPPHQKMRLSACSKSRKLLGSLVSKSLIPSLGYISAPSPAHGARRLEAGRNPKHSARNRFQLAQVPCF